MHNLLKLLTAGKNVTIYFSDENKRYVSSINGIFEHYIECETHYKMVFYNFEFNLYKDYSVEYDGDLDMYTVNGNIDIEVY